MHGVTESLALLSGAIETYKPVAVYGLFSGGHDSLTATHVAARHPGFTAAAHINTGIGIEDTRLFVRQTCIEQYWKLKEYRAEDCGQIYREIVLRFGFPGPYSHQMMYSRLKERALRCLIRETKTGYKDKVLLVTGVRSQESQRRMGHVEQIQVDGAKVWVAIIHNWSKRDCNDYIDENNLPRNPVVDLMHMSGECLCGAFAHKGELAEIKLWYPETAARIEQLQEEVKAAGHSWEWEEKPPHTRKKAIDKRQMPLCYGCIHASEVTAG